MEKIMAKQKKGAMSAGMGILLALVLLIGAGAGFYGLQQTQMGDDDDGRSIDCNTEPSVRVSALDAINTGTSVDTSNHYARLNDNYYGNISSDDTFKGGDSLDLLVEKDGYLNEVVAEDMELECGTNTLNPKLYASTPGEMKFSNEDNDVLTDDDSADPASDTTQDASDTRISIDGQIQSNADEATGDLVIVVEADNDTEVDEILSNAEEVSVPEFYSSQSANSKTVAFEYDSLTDGAKDDFNIDLTPESGQELGSQNMTVYVTAYAKQADVDQDGTFIENAVEDSDGNSIYENSFDYDFVVGSA